MSERGSIFTAQLSKFLQNLKHSNLAEEIKVEVSALKTIIYKKEAYFHVLWLVLVLLVVVMVVYVYLIGFAFMYFVFNPLRQGIGLGCNMNNSALLLGR